MRDYAALDADALVQIVDPVEWAFTVLNKAIAQCDPFPQWVVDTWERLERMDAAALAAVRAALEGKVPVDGLDHDGHELFYDFFPHVGPHPEATKFYAAMRERGDMPNDQDRMERGLLDGKAEVLKDAGGDD